MLSSASNNSELTREEKIDELGKIEEQLKNDPSTPLYAYRKENDYQTVTGEGDPDASILFIGEAPGAKEAETGRPFVGRAGQMLNTLLESIGLSRQEVYITNIVKDRPPGNRDPRAAEIAYYAPYLQRQLKIIQPKVIATLGRFSMNFILDQYDLPVKDQTIGDLHGELLTAKTSFGIVKILPLYHPAAMFYNRKLQPVIEKDFKILEQFASSKTNSG